MTHMSDKLTAVVLGALLASGCVDPDLRRGNQALGSGNYREAIVYYEMAREKLPGDQAPKERLASAHRALATALIGEGKCEDARAQIGEAEALSAPVLADRRALYDCVTARGLPPDKELPEIRSLVAAGDKRVVLLRRRLQLELQIGDDAAAVASLRQLEGRDGGLGLQDRHTLSQALLRLNQTEPARAELTKLVAAEPNDPMNRLQLADLEEQYGDRAAAGRLYEALATDFPTNLLVMLRLAAHRRAAGDEPGAAAAEAAADALRGDKPPVRTDLRPLRKSRR